MVYFAAFVELGKEWCIRHLRGLEAVVSVLGVVYLVAALLVALYGGNSLLLAVLHLRRR
jgi:hypothetical protein